MTDIRRSGRSTWERLIKPTPGKRLLFFLTFDVLLVLASLWLAMLLRFEFSIPGSFLRKYWGWAIWLVVNRVLFLALFGLYTINWRFVGIIELKNAIKAMALSALIILSANQVLLQIWPSAFMSRGVLLMEIVLSFTLICFLRISKRLFFTFFRNVEGIPTMIIGVDGLGERLIMEMISQKNESLYPTVVLDRDKSKTNTTVHGIPVVCGYERIGETVRRYKIRTVLINLKPSERRQVEGIFRKLSRIGVKDVRIVPSIGEYNNDVFHAKQFKQLAIEDLMARDPVQIESGCIGKFLSEKTVLVTGAAGSIGSEIVRQLILFNAGKVIAFEIDETELFNLNRELDYWRRRYKTELVSVLGDVRDYKKLDETFKRYKPDLVFHASAYKHVPVLEAYPEEGVKTNIFGTRNLVDLALRHQCAKVVNISTDKAVNPSSMMGASKRMAERICRVANGDKTRFISVRFGNVLGSRGSVIPIFLDQIKRGGPVTVTHADMKRYFMSIPEAVQLVFQASYMGQGGEVFVLDMGEPIKILDLAHNLIRMNGLEPDADIEVRFTGLRPGEKMFEELLTAEEGVSSTYHEQVFVSKSSESVSASEMEDALKKLSDVLHDRNRLIQVLQDLVPFSCEEKASDPPGPGVAVV